MLSFLSRFSLFPHFLLLYPLFFTPYVFVLLFIPPCYVFNLSLIPLCYVFSLSFNLHFAIPFLYPLLFTLLSITSLCYIFLLSFILYSSFITLLCLPTIPLFHIAIHFLYPLFHFAISFLCPLLHFAISFLAAFFRRLFIKLVFFQGFPFLFFLPPFSCSSQVIFYPFLQFQFFPT